MFKLKQSNESPGLLVSVRSAAEALAALAGGADVIDVKEPNQGSLGAADDETISAIVRAVKGRAPLSAAMGELIDWIDSPNGDSIRRLVDGVSLFKLGLARCATLHDWQARWSHTIETMTSTSPNRNSQAVAVVYADWQAAQSPAPQDVLDAAIRARCPALLVDTWDKSSGALFDHWAADELQRFITQVRSRDIAVVLAGSLIGPSISTAARLAPDLVAVRTAACDAGRSGTVSQKKVRELKNAIITATQDMAVL
jgi:hypothetical protein